MSLRIHRDFHSGSNIYESINRFSLRDLFLLTLHHTGVWIFSCDLESSHCSAIRRRRCVRPAQNYPSKVPTAVPFPVIFLLLSAHFSDKLGSRWPFIFAGFLSSAAGFSINLSNAPIGAKYFGTFLCVAGAYSSSPGVLAWLGFRWSTVSVMMTGSS